MISDGRGAREVDVPGQAAGRSGRAEQLLDLAIEVEVDSFPNFLRQDSNTCDCSKPGLMVPMARILVVGVVFIAAPYAFAELKPAKSDQCRSLVTAATQCIGTPRRSLRSDSGVVLATSYHFVRRTNPSERGLKFAG